MADEPIALHNGACPPRDGGEYMLNPATRLLWRGPRTVQLELGGDGVVVDGLALQTIRSIATRTSDTCDTIASPRLDRHAALALDALADAGFLWPRRHDSPSASTDDRLVAPSARLAGELRALQVRHGQDASRTLAARRHASVEIEGTHRVAAQLAAVLAAAGVGRVRCAVSGRVTLALAAPGGVAPAEEGDPLAAAADAAIRRAAPEVDQCPVDGPVDLTVLALDAPVPDERRHGLHAADAPYLCVSAGIDRGVVGPLVVPGLTSCVRCADLIRADRDPAWNALAVQLAMPSRYGPASAIALTTMVTGIAARQVLSFLDGEHPAALDGTLELTDPDWQVRRRSWGIHPECGCTEN